jgi:hypothetical protein
VARAERRHLVQLNPGSVRYHPGVIAPGFGAVGFGIALLAVGGVLVGKGNNVGGLACDFFGVVLIWSAIKMRRPDD